MFRGASFFILYSLLRRRNNNSWEKSGLLRKNCSLEINGSFKITFEAVCPTVKGQTDIDSCNKNRLNWVVHINIPTQQHKCLSPGYSSVQAEHIDKMLLWQHLSSIVCLTTHTRSTCQHQITYRAELYHNLIDLYITLCVCDKQLLSVCVLLCLCLFLLFISAAVPFLQGCCFTLTPGVV